MNFETLKVDISDHIARITLNRPDKKNAMNPRLHVEMTELLETLRYEDDVKVLVITGSGNAFCAGMDLKEFFHELKVKNPKEFRRVFRMAGEWRGRTLRQYPKPTIAMVNGYCFGGAFSIVEGCDLAVAAQEATFGLSEVNFRGFPGGPVSKSLANIMHPRDALLYAMTGRTFSGSEAEKMKFVNFAVPLADLERETMALAREIAAKDATALRACKDGYRYSLEMSWDASISYTAAKEDEVYMAQKGGWIESGIGDFVEGKYKPGLQGNEEVGGGR
ncbi:p-hydroxycinnamoyl CoA hydratase/lyase [Oricola thermophila]|uniref:p-hydroxycinnamoyl CoA hydratase/lyase n=1 Tax=Oricola thermophila TaxID=2742145 RepID=A0A6N1VGX6_9HYPH|nr:p-hydroxycinnamoyl CoA hydratase/lyase [Oricola thermophila]QKV20176.1 p-hydroxycinnamoyl CoA hydratase/lyase [Oricola thermophila]